MQYRSDKQMQVYNNIIDEQIWASVLDRWGFGFHILMNDNVTNDAVSAIQFLLKNRFYQDVNQTGTTDYATTKALYSVRYMAGLSYTTNQLLLNRDGWYLLIAGCIPPRDNTMLLKVLFLSLAPTVLLIIIIILVTAGVTLYYRKKDRMPYTVHIEE
jgi:hypothetical protein